MVQGLINQTNRQIEKLKDYLRANETTLDEDELNEILERLSILIQQRDLLTSA